jgi:hypothetical protein
MDTIKRENKDSENRTRDHLISKALISRQETISTQ